MGVLIEGLGEARPIRRRVQASIAVLGRRGRQVRRDRRQFLLDLLPLFPPGVRRPEPLPIAGIPESHEVRGVEIRPVVVVRERRAQREEVRAPEVLDRLLFSVEEAIQRAVVPGRRQRRIYPEPEGECSRSELL